ncbi:MAG: ABC transporter permease [Xanthomonadales bacterium]|nr:ABC transporter permease [Xanthomonadales bacterium]
MLTGWIQDFKQALRGLTNRPGFAVAAIATLALGIGANTAVFSVLNGLLLKPLPYAHGERLVEVHNSYPKSGLDYAGTSIPDYLDRRQAPALEDLALYTGVSFNLSGEGAPQRVEAVKATASLFTTLGASAALGRVFGPDEEVVGQDRVIVLSDGLWRSQFAAAPDIIGRDIRLNGENWTVLGVMPADFAFPRRSYSAWVPFAFTEALRSDDERGNEYSQAIGRLASGATTEQLEAQFAAQVQRNAERIAGLDDPRAAGFAEFLRSGAFIGRAKDLREHWVGDLAPVLYLLQAVVLFVLLIACANVANLMLTRVLARQRELSVRAALGAGRWRIIRQVLAEALLLAAVGGVAGVAVAHVGLALMNAFQLGGGALAEQISIDPKVLLFTLGVSLLTGVLFGLLPAVGQMGAGHFNSLKEGGRNRGGSRRTALARQGLVVIQLSLAVCLLVGAGLLLRSFISLQQQSPGFDARGVVTARFDLPPGSYEDLARRSQFIERSLESLSAIPGVQQTAYVSNMPFGGSYWQSSYNIKDREFPIGQTPHGIVRMVDDNYFDSLRIQVLRGRVFGPEDRADSEPVIVVDRLLAEKYFPDQDAVGQTIVWSGPDEQSRNYTIIGVVDAIKHQDLSAELSKESYYLHYRQMPQNQGFLLVRTELPGEQLAPAIREAVLKVDPEQAVYSVMSLEQRVALSLEKRRAPLTLLLIFAGVALVLSAIGIYGVLAFGVQQRSAEMGVRMAIGAQRGDVQRLVLGQGGRLIAIGLAVGAVGALALSRAIQAQLYQVNSTDPWTFLIVLVLLGGVALLACWLPARRASRTDPMVALRYE